MRKKIYTRYGSSPRVGKARARQSSMVVLKEVCEPRGDLSAACDRIMMLAMLNAAGPLLNPSVGEFDGAVFRLDARFPMTLMQKGVVYPALPFDAEEFVKQVENERSR
jgi:hypothetical protein